MALQRFEHGQEIRGTIATRKLRLPSLQQESRYMISVDLGSSENKDAPGPAPMRHASRMLRGLQSAVDKLLRRAPPVRRQSMMPYSPTTCHLDRCPRTQRQTVAAHSAEREGEIVCKCPGLPRHLPSGHPCWPQARPLNASA